MAATRGQNEQVLPEPETLEGKTFSLLTGVSVPPQSHTTPLLVSGTSL